MAWANADPHLQRRALGMAATVASHDIAGVLRILDQHGDNLVDGHRVVMRMPAVVIGDHGDGDVADLRFAREFGFLQVGHADHVHAPTAIDIRLGFGGKLRAFHANISAAALAVRRPAFLQAAANACGQLCADRIAESDVRHDAIAEKSVDPMAGAIEELIGNHKIERLVFFLQRSDGGNRDDALNAELFEAVNIGAKIEFAGQNAVAATVAGEKGDLAAFECSENVSVGRIAEWRLLPDFMDIGETGHGVQATASDNANFCLLQLRSWVEWKWVQNW